MQSYELTDFEWGVIAPLLPNKPRGVPRVDDRRVLNGIFWVLRTGAPWRALPKEFGPHTTCYNRFVRWRKAGVWDRVLAAVTQAYDGSCPARRRSPVDARRLLRRKAVGAAGAADHVAKRVEHGKRVAVLQNPGARFAESAGCFDPIL
jgi:transposase